MALTREEVRDEYLKRVYKIFLRYEKVIDNILVDKFNELKSKGLLEISEGRIMGAHHYDSFNDKYREQLVALIGEKYSCWKVIYNEGINNFVFYYEEKEENLIPLLANLEERFKAMDLDEDVEPDFEVAVEDNEDDKDSGLDW